MQVEFLISFPHEPQAIVVTYDEPPFPYNKTGYELVILEKLLGESTPEKLMMTPEERYIEMLERAEVLEITLELVDQAEFVETGNGTVH